MQRLEDVWCGADSDWVVALLTVHAPHLVEVSVSQVDHGVLEALHAMALHRGLRGLQVWHCDPALHTDAMTVTESEQEAVDGDGGGERLGLQWIDIFDLPEVSDQVLSGTALDSL